MLHLWETVEKKMTGKKQHVHRRRIKAPFEGLNLWSNDDEERKEAIDAEMKEGDRLEAILNESRQQRPTEHTDWTEEVNQQAEEYKAEQAEKQEQEQLRQEQARKVEDKIIGRKPKQESEEEQSENKKES